MRISEHHRLLDARKDEFIAMAGYELRTPLTAIRGFMELLEKRYTKKRLHLMRIQVDKLTQLTRDLMDTSKIRTGKLVLTKIRFNLGELISETILSLQPSTKQKIIKKVSQKIVIYADRGRIGEVLTNLLTNAAKYSQPETKIIVSLRKADSKVIVSVTDFGIGIGKIEQKRIFDPFYQGKHPITPGRGLGLGLFISSQIIKLHKGKIWVESIPHKGSTFFFNLPL